MELTREPSNTGNAGGGGGGAADGRGRDRAAKRPQRTDRSLTMTTLTTVGGLPAPRRRPAG